MANGQRLLAAAICAAFAVATLSAAFLGVPTSARAQPDPVPAPSYAQSVPQISPEASAFANAGAREVSSGDPDEDATLAAQADAEDHGIAAITGHEAALRKVLADVPDPFVRERDEGGIVTYRGDSMADCAAFAATLRRAAAGGPTKFVCRGNPFAAAAFYLGSYYNEIGKPDEALATLDRGLVAGPNATLLIAERNVALIALHRWDDVLAGAARGLAIANLSPKDRALMLRNRGFALTALNRLDEAQRAYEDSLLLVPDNALAKNELRYIAGLKAGAAPTEGAIFMPNKPKSN
jgi:tetratricopeptide (TPR) repeat protein